MVTPDLDIRQRYPPDATDASIVRDLLQQARVPRPPAPLTLTFMRGEAVAYLEPGYTLSMTDEQLDYLAARAACLRRPV